MDVALLGQGYMDVASWSELTNATGGTLYQYTPFTPVLDHDQVLDSPQVKGGPASGLELCAGLISNRPMHCRRLEGRPND